MEGRQNSLSDDLPSRLYTKYHQPSAQSKAISRRLILIVAGNLLVKTSLVLSLWGFARLGDLNKNPWIKRVSTSVVLTLGAILSIGIGALFDQIGYLIRWPLLARKNYTLQEIDDIFQLGSLTGSFRLLFRSPAATAVRFFLLSSIVGRVSVGLFALGYNINDMPITSTYPEIRASVWPEVANISSSILDSVLGPASTYKDVLAETEAAGVDFDDDTGAEGAMYALMLAGLNEMAIPPESTNSNHTSTWDLEKNLQMNYMSLKVDENDTSVSYEYFMRNFNNTSAASVASNRSISVGTKCTRSKPQSDDAYLDEGSGQTISLRNILTREMLLELQLEQSPQRNFLYQEVWNEVWTRPVNYQTDLDMDMVSILNKVTFDTCGPRCSTFWVLGLSLDLGTNYVARCLTNLSEISQSGSEVEDTLKLSDRRSWSILAAAAYDPSGGLVGSMVNKTNSNITNADNYYTSAFLNEETLGSMEGDIVPENLRKNPESSNGSNTIVRDFSHYREQFPEAGGWLRELNVFTYPTEENVSTSYNQPLFLFPDVAFGGEPSEDTVYYEIDPHLGVNLNSSHMEVWLAGLLSRMPAALIAYLDTSGILNQTVLEYGSTAVKIQSHLEIDWWKLWSTVGIMTAAQIVAVVATMWYCRTVVVRDNSALIIAHTMRTLSQEFSYDVSSIAKKEELARCLGNVKVRYGTAWSAGVPNVDIRREGQVKSTFPAGEYD